MTDQGILPASCGLVAAQKAWELFHKNIPCRIMGLRLGPGKGEGVYHFVTVFRMPEANDGTADFYGYAGETGSRHLGRHNVETAHVVDFAEAYQPGSTAAKWVSALVP